MLTVIFGAGASYAATDGIRSIAEAAKMPLARNLFDEGSPFKLRATRNYPKVKGLIIELIKCRNEDGPNIEDELARLQYEAKTNSDKTGELMAARYYLRDVTRDTAKEILDLTSDRTNYDSFIRMIRDWRIKNETSINLITFNYEQLIEKACTDMLSWNFNSIDSYISGLSDWKLFRPHGSTNWEMVLDNMRFTDPVKGRELEADDIIKHAEIIDNGYLTHHGEYFVVGTYDPRNKICIPALSIPTNNKNKYSCPDELIVEMISSVKSTKKLILVGWRASEEHFKKDMLNGISGNNMDILIVSSDVENARKIQSTVEDTIGDQHTFFLYEGEFASLCNGENSELLNFLNK